jgi:hypothetical protein
MKMKLSVGACGLILAVALAGHAEGATIVVQAMSTFGGDGWLAPDEPGYLTTVPALSSTAGTERSIGYNPDSDHLYVPTRGNGIGVMILDARTGTQVGFLDTTGIGGGDLAINNVAVSRDGTIYAGNVTVNATTKTFKLYSWTDELAFPQVVYDGTPIDAARVGDTLDVIGAGASARLVAGYSNTTVGYTVINPNTGIATHVDVPGTVAGDFRLGITFAEDENHVWGSQGAAGIRRTKTDGTLLGTTAHVDGTERPMDFIVFKGIPLLATIEAGSTGATLDNDVRIFDMTDPAAPVLLSTVNLTTSEPYRTGAPAQGTGSVVWGAVDEVNSTLTLYALGTNNGIQAFIVTIPEPGIGMICIASGLILMCRGRVRPAVLRPVCQ